MTTKNKYQVNISGNDPAQVALENVVHLTYEQGVLHFLDKDETILLAVPQHNVSYIQKV